MAGSVYLPTFLFALGIGAVVPVIPLFARDLGAGDGLVGVIVAMRAIGTTTLDVPAGLAASRFGQRITIGVAAWERSASKGGGRFVSEAGWHNAGISATIS